PCYPSGDPCIRVVCDPTLKICTELDVDGGPLCTANGAPCTTSADCATGLSCGYPLPAAGANACGATGQCINPPLACEDDAASCAAGGTPVCGCNGEPDPLVIPGFASSPVASLTP